MAGESSVYGGETESKQQSKKFEISSFKKYRVLKKGILYSKSTKKIICKILQNFNTPKMY